MRTTGSPSDDPENLMGRILAVIAAAVLFRLADQLYVFGGVIDRPRVIISLFGIYLFSFVLLTVAVVGIDITRWGTVLAGGAYLVALPGLYFAFFVNHDITSVGTDALLFSQYAVDLLLEGENPYANSMMPAFERYGLDHRFVTYQVDGTFVDSLSYPALSFLYFVPQTLLGIPNLNLTSIVVVLLSLAFLIRESPSHLALAPFAVFFADPSITFFSYGGVFDILWVLPLLLAMKFWARGQLPVAATLVGLAFAVKQTAWFVAPFLAIWLYLESDTQAVFRQRAGTCLTFGFAGFLLPNIPFIIWNPGAWTRSVLLPMLGGVGLVQQGRGLVVLSSTGLAPLPTSFFTVTLLVLLVASLCLYSLYFDAARWLAWLAPILLLWVNYRSLQNYFIFFIPIAYYAVLLRGRTSSWSDTTGGSGHVRTE